jgi:hypothetical protein
LIPPNAPRRRTSRTATGSFHAATALTDVLALHAAPLSLVRPSVLLSAPAGPLRPHLDGPPFTVAERGLPATPERPAEAAEYPVTGARGLAQAPNVWRKTAPCPPLPPS